MTDRVFSMYCGHSVKLVRSEKGNGARGRYVRYVFSVPAVDDEGVERQQTVYIKNTTPAELAICAMCAGKLAAETAYFLTGQFAGDLANAKLALGMR